MRRKLWVLVHSINVLEGKMDNHMIKALGRRKITTDEITWVSAHRHEEKIAKFSLKFVNTHQIKITSLTFAKRNMRKIKILIEMLH